MMTSRYAAGLIIVLVLGMVLVTVLTVGLAGAEQFAQLPAEQGAAPAPRIYQQTDPNLLVPKSTLYLKQDRYLHNWDDNPVAYIPESTMLAWGAVNSEQVNAQGNCTLQTIKGTYIFEARGSNVNEDGNVLPYAEAGIWTLDGEGNAAGFISIGIDGENFVTKEPFTARYELVSECVFEARDEFGLVVDLYTTPSGSTIMYYSPGFSGTMLKQTPVVAAETGQEDQAREASAAWDEAFNAENIEQLMELYAEDAVSMPFGVPALEGKDAIQSDFETIFANFDFQHKTTIVGLLMSGNVAVERGEYTLAEEGETTEEGKHIVVREKSADGWKVVWEIWNTHE